MGCSGIKTKPYPLLPEEETFRKIKRIGEFGEVFLIISNKTNIPYAAKIIKLNNPTEEKMKQAFSEVKILKECNHPNIILLKDVFKERKEKGVNLNIITEYCDEGDLEVKIEEQKRIKKYFEEIQLINWLMQISLALKYLHKKKKLFIEI